MDLTKTPRKVWEHANPKSTAMWAFMQEANKLHGLNLTVYTPELIIFVSLIVYLLVLGIQ
jgi:hypothetical protein